MLYLSHIIMVFELVIFLAFLQPIVSHDWLSWSDYKKINFLKTNTMKEHNYRKEIYIENLAKVRKHNEKFRQGLVSYSLEMNQFGHLTEKEFTEKYTAQYDDIKIKPSQIYVPPKNFTLPAIVDWRLKNAVTPVKSQRNCNNCNIFAALSTIESHYFIKYKKLASFSVQQVIDCGKKYHKGSDGCRRSGFIDMVYKYVADFGLTFYDKYPHESVAGPCRIKHLPIIVKLKDFKAVKKSSVCDMRAAIAFQGPVSVGLNGTHLQFISGKEILTGNWCNSNSAVTHVASVVGYGRTPEGLIYWIVKNSWGVQWGNKGYFYVESSEKDHCALTQTVYIPNVE